MVSNQLSRSDVIIYTPVGRFWIMVSLLAAAVLAEVPIFYLLGDRLIRAFDNLASSDFLDLAMTAVHMGTTVLLLVLLVVWCYTIA